MSAIGGFNARRLSRRSVLRGGGIAGLGIAGAALIGCGDDEATPTPEPSDGGSNTSTPAPTSSSGDATATATEAAAEPSFPDEFIVANAAEPPDLLPWFGGFEQALVTRQVYQTLIEPRLTLAADGSPQWEMVGVLAESWERDGDNAWLIKLREGVRFHNGDRYGRHNGQAHHLREPIEKRIRRNP